MKWAAFLDRDGILVEYVDLLHKPEQLHLASGAAAAVKRLHGAGAVVVVVTNQPVVARGLVNEEGLRRIHERMKNLLAEQGAALDAIYYCPHHPETHHPEASDPRYRRDCACRKPKTGMLLDAAKHFDVDIAKSFLIGDSMRDMQAARNAGCRGVLVRVGVAGKDKGFDARPDAVCDDLTQAVDWVIAHAKEAAKP